MRPVTRGAAPNTYTAYKQAFNDLVTRMGRYCSYCERFLPTSLAVEHVVPKSLDPALETAWDNFLLGCTNCNSVKLAQPTNQRDFLWPDRDNTFRAYEYAAGGYVRVMPGLTRAVKSKAVKLMSLVGLERHPDSGPPAPAAGDQRWMQRDEIWKLAERCRDRITRLDAVGCGDEGRAFTLELAQARGFFSVWLTVFSADTAMLNLLISGFPGTTPECFDASGKAIKRQGGRI